jgi:transcription elongation factor GreB
MSRGFVNEDDQEEVPIVPPRADLPDGITNYVTEAGMQELVAEKQKLLTERENLDSSDEKEHRIAFNHINAKLQLLNSRIKTAQVVDSSNQPQDEVRFGALVTLKIGKNAKHQSYQIVGADEADFSKGKISFIAPIAQLLTGKKVGEKAVLKLKNEERVFEIIDIRYP